MKMFFVVENNMNGALVIPKIDVNQVLLLER